MVVPPLSSEGKTSTEMLVESLLTYSGAGGLEGWSASRRWLASEYAPQPISFAHRYLTQTS